MDQVLIRSDKAIPSKATRTAWDEHIDKIKKEMQEYTGEQ